MAQHDTVPETFPAPLESGPADVGEPDLDRLFGRRTKRIALVIALVLAVLAAYPVLSWLYRLRQVSLEDQETPLFSEAEAHIGATDLARVHQDLLPQFFVGLGRGEVEGALVELEAALSETPRLLRIVDEWAHPPQEWGGIELAIRRTQLVDEWNAELVNARKPWALMPPLSESSDPSRFYAMSYYVLADLTAPDPAGTGAARSMVLALKDAQLQPDQIDYINAHGTSTPLGDAAEVMAIKSVFGEHAKKLAISSTKGVTGHTLGASGGIESMAVVRTIAEQVVPPTANLDHPDFDLDFVPNKERKMNVRYAMNNSFGFGGHNVSLIFGRFDG